MTANPRAKWTVTVHDVLVGKLQAQKRYHPVEFDALCRTMELLAQEDDPRHPRNPRLNVCPLQRDAPGWYRVRVDPVNWRAVFRLLEKRDGRIIEVHEADALRGDHQGHAIQLTDTSHRRRAYGPQLWALWKKAG